MSGFIVACWRDEQANVTQAELEACATRLAPDNIRAHPPIVVTRPGLALCVTNPVRAAVLTSSGVVLGRLLGPDAGWDVCGSPAPDGSYAITRFDECCVELLSDAVASRPIWYVRTERLFLASTSQRALVTLLRSFQPDPMATTWLLSCGNLGPEAGWDARAARMPGNARLRFDRSRWDLHVAHDEMGCEASEASAAESVRHLYETIVSACRDMGLDDPGFMLPLSGGLDSRSILLAMRAAGMRPRCITWGAAAAPRDPRSDASVARLLAHELDLEHRFYAIEPAEDLAAVLRRFVALGEGAVEDIACYVDGMALFATLFDAGVEGLVRGDAPSFGEYHVYGTERQARIRENGLLVSDYGPTHVIRRLGLREQVWPEALRQCPGEGLEAYSARVYEQYHVAAALAPLNHIKCAYLEIANPLLSRRVIAAAHGLSDSMRRGRRSQKEIASRYGPAVPFAVRHPAAVPGGLLALEPIMAEVRRALGSKAAGAVFPEEALATLRGAAAAAEPRLKASLKSRAKEIVPKSIVELLHPVPAVGLSPRRLAFRAYIAIRTHELLREDADLLPARSFDCSEDQQLATAI